MAGQLGTEQINVTPGAAVLLESAPSSQTEVRELFRVAHQASLLQSRFAPSLQPLSLDLISLLSKLGKLYGFSFRFHS